MRTCSNLHYQRAKLSALSRQYQKNSQKHLRKLHNNIELSVEKRLKDAGVKYQLVPLAGKVVTHADAEQFVSLNPDDDCKTIIVSDKAGDAYAFFLRGMMRLDFSKVKQLLGKSVSVMSREKMVLKTRLEPGAVCPLLLSEIPLYVDRQVLSRKQIHFGSGDVQFDLSLCTTDLLKLAKHELVDVAAGNIAE